MDVEYVHAEYVFYNVNLKKKKCINNNHTGNTLTVAAQKILFTVIDFNVVH